MTQTSPHAPSRPRRLTPFRPSGKAALVARSRRLGRGLGGLRPVIVVVAVLVAVFWQPLPASAAGVDTDGDTVTDDIDIDDDNDGIIDINETAENFQYATYNPISGTTATGTINSISFTYTSSTTILSTAGMFNVGTFPASYNVPDSNPTIRNDIASTNTITFSQPALNPMVVFSSIGNPSTFVPVQFDRDVEVLWSTDVTVNSSSRITGNEGFAILQISGEVTSFSFDYLANEAYVNFAFGADPRQTTDTDSDTLADHLDLDSDDDGITDNVEAQSTAGYLAPSGDDTDGNGLDDVYESTPGAGEGLTPVNTDNIGEDDVRDLDSDEDGTPDIEERGDGQPITLTSMLDTDTDGLLDIFEGSDVNDGFDVNDENRTATTIDLATDVALAADGSNAVPLSVDYLYRDAISTTDSDGDGIPDVTEIGGDHLNPIDTDGTGQPDFLDTDSDGDGIIDSVERGVDVSSIVFTSDTDDDGIPNAMDVDLTAGADTDSDGIDDTFAPIDTDNDGTADFIDTDSDNDATPDATDPNRLTAVAAADAAFTRQGVSVTVDVLANDDFVASASLAIVDLGTGTGAGTVSTDPTTGELTYGPTAAETGSVTVDYRVCHIVVSPSVCADATATVSITPDADLDGNPDSTDPSPGTPTAAGDAGSTLQGVAVTLDVLANDDFVAGASVSLVDLGTGSGSGSVAADPAAGDVTYTPTAGETGDVTVDYRVCHTAVSPPVCADATVTVSITPDADGDSIPDAGDADDDNDGNPDTTDPNPRAAVAVDDAGSTLQGDAVTVDVLANDDLAAGSSVSLVDLGTGSALGMVTADPVTGELTYTPTAVETGDVTVDYRVCHTAVSPAVCADATLTIDIEPLATIRGRIYLDLDRDGEIDTGEVDISGVDVWLMGPGPDGHLGTDDDEHIATTTTASPFVFDDVVPGSYRIKVDVATLPVGVAVTNDGDGGSDQALTVSVDGNDVTSLTMGQNYRALSGVVLGDDGAPLTFTTVTVVDGAGHTFTATTDAYGSFFIEGREAAPLAGGGATVSVVGKTGKTVTKTVAVAGGVEPARTVIATTTVPTVLAYTGSNPRVLASMAFGLLFSGASLISVARQRESASQRRLAWQMYSRR